MKQVIGIQELLRNQKLKQTIDDETICGSKTDTT